MQPSTTVNKCKLLPKRLTNIIQLSTIKNPYLTLNSKKQILISPQEKVTFSSNEVKHQLGKLNREVAQPSQYVSEYMQFPVYRPEDSNIEQAGRTRAHSEAEITHHSQEKRDKRMKLKTKVTLTIKEEILSSCKAFPTKHNR